MVPHSNALPLRRVQRLQRVGGNREFRGDGAGRLHDLLDRAAEVLGLLVEVTLRRLVPGRRAIRERVDLSRLLRDGLEVDGGFRGVQGFVAKHSGLGSGRMILLELNGVTGVVGITDNGLPVFGHPHRRSAVAAVHVEPLLHAPCPELVVAREQPTPYQQRLAYLAPQLTLLGGGGLDA